MKTPIIGQSYAVGQAAADRCVNLYAETITSGGKENAFLARCPGLRPLATVGDGPIRGQHRMGAYLYVASGRKLYRVDSGFSVEELGWISGDDLPVSMADNGTQLFVACSGPSYIYTDADGLVQVYDKDFPGAEQVAYIDGYFAFTEPDTQRLWVTAALDGMDIDALEYASAEGAPDKIVGMIANHRELWLLGEYSTEVWYDSGATDFPLARIQGAFIETGCAAGGSVVTLDNTVYWLAADSRGQGIVMRAGGYTGQRISTHAIERAIASYDDISDAVAYSYTQFGHSFYVISFPSGGQTWCFDAATGLWHERATLDDVGQFTACKGQHGVAFSGRVVVGDNQTGSLYELDPDYYLDGTAPHKWLRSWRALPQASAGLTRTVHDSLIVDFAAGVGTVSGQGIDPAVSLRWSDDGGMTWSNYHQRSIGKMGDYDARAKWDRLGMSRNRIYELSGTDPMPISILGADLRLRPTAA